MGFITSRTNLAGLSENELRLVNELLMIGGGQRAFQCRDRNTVQPSNSPAVSVNPSHGFNDRTLSLIQTKG